MSDTLTTRVFITRWDDECNRCGGLMPAGTEAVYEDDELCHAVDCEQADDPDLETAVEACPRCFTVPATNGACGCD